MHTCPSWKLKQIDFDWIEKKNFLFEDRDIGTGCLEDCTVPHCVDSLGFSKPAWEEAWEARFELVGDPAFSRRLDPGPSVSSLPAWTNVWSFSIFPVRVVKKILSHEYFSWKKLGSKKELQNLDKIPSFVSVCGELNKCFFLNYCALPHHLICWNVVYKIFAETSPALLSQRTQAWSWYLFKDGKH